MTAPDTDTLVGLLACPFCGNDGPKLIRPMGDRLDSGPPYYGPQKYRYCCGSMKCCAMTDCWDTEPEARAQWNTRHTSDAEVIALRAERDALADDHARLMRDFTALEAERTQLRTAQAASRAGEDALAYDLRRIAEGNLGDNPWQANYERIRNVAADALAAYDARRR